MKWHRLAARCILAATTYPAHAALTENLGTSLEAMSMGNAVVASPMGISAIHFNPAGLANLEGDRSTKSLFGAQFKSASHFEQPPGYSVGGWSQDPVAGRDGKTFRSTFIVPGRGVIKQGLPFLLGASAGWTWNLPGSGLTFGNAIYPTLGVGYARPEADDPASHSTSYLAMQRIAFLAPSVGYKLSEQWQVGVSFPISYTSLAVGIDARMPNFLLGIVGKVQEGFCPTDGSNPLDAFLFGICNPGPQNHLSPYKTVGRMDLSASAPIDIGYNVGVLWNPVSWASFGATYRSGSSQRMSGTYTLQVDDSIRLFAAGLYSSLIGPIAAAALGIPPDIPSVQSGNIQVVLPLPAVWQLGVSLRPTKHVRFNVDATRASWSQFRSVRMFFDKPVFALQAAKIAGIADATAVEVPRGYVSRWHLGYGLSWDVADRLQFRVGYEPRKSSIPAEKIDLIVPLGDMKIYSVGMTWKVDDGYEWSLNLSQGKTKFHAPANTSCNLNCTNFQNFIYNPYAGLDVSGSLSFWMGGITINRKF